jgi:hypothetical protein
LITNRGGWSGILVYQRLALKDAATVPVKCITMKNYTLIFYVDNGLDTSQRSRKNGLKSGKAVIYVVSQGQ